MPRASPFEKSKAHRQAHAGKEQLAHRRGRGALTRSWWRRRKVAKGGHRDVLSAAPGAALQRESVAQVRDLDDDGRVLWIPSGKTHNARRRQKVPDALRPFLVESRRGRAERYLFGRRPRTAVSTSGWRQVKNTATRANPPARLPTRLCVGCTPTAVAAGCTLRRGGVGAGPRELRHHRQSTTSILIPCATARCGRRRPSPAVMPLSRARRRRAAPRRFGTAAPLSKANAQPFAGAGR